MKKGLKKVFEAFVMVLIALSAVTAVDAASAPLMGVSIDSVEINGVSNIHDGDTVQTRFERGETLDIAVKIKAERNQAASDVLDNVRINAEIKGDKHHNIEDESGLFDIEFDGMQTTYVQENLKLTLPEDMEQDQYFLTVSVYSRSYGETSNKYRLLIDTINNKVIIKDIDFNQNPIKAGRGLESYVRLKNVGNDDERNVRVSFSIPELGLHAADDYINDLDSEEYKSSEALYVRMPECTTPGTYKAKVTVEYDDGYDQVTEYKDLHVIEGDLCEAVKEPVQVWLESEAQEIEAGEVGTYTFVFTNEGTSSKTYSMMVKGTDNWAEVSVAPSNVFILEPGKTQQVAIKVKVDEDAEEGEKTFNVDVQSAGKSLQEVPLKAQVTGGSSNVLTVLLYTLLVITVLSVIAAATVLYLKKRQEKEESGEETDMGEDFGEEADFEEDLGDEEESYY